MTSQTIQEALKMQAAMELKFTYRFGDRLQGKQESVAAHSWSMMLMADYLLAKLEEFSPGKYDLDLAKIYKLIAYHDLIEAQTGDEDLDPGNAKNHSSKQSREIAAMETFPKKLPDEIQSVFYDMYEQYEKRESLESKFVKIVDCLEAEYFCIGKPYLFENWTKEFHESKRLHHFVDFPELLYLQKEVIEYANTNYYSKK